MPHQRVLLFASGNPGKLFEYRAAAFDRGFLVETVPRFDEMPACIEDGESFEENACKKALHYSGAADGLVFADDSGICVDALGGEPGILSARYAGPEANDEANNRKLLDELSRFPAEQRSAHYVCVIALAHGARLLGTFEGRADGVILGAPKGTGGFGYDPYFFYPPANKTFAQITPQEKFAVSHRGHAYRNLLEFLLTLDPE
jgi:XTP/dITP diphosphohydrolase